MKFMLLFCGTLADQRAFDALSPAELAQRYAQVGRWFADHAPQLRSSIQLQSLETATCVRFADAGEPIVTEGTFMPGTAGVGGYAEIEVADLDEALSMAKTWPGRGVVEIRPVMAQEY